MPEPEPADAEESRECGDQENAQGHGNEAIRQYKRAARTSRDGAHHTRLGDAYVYAEDSRKAVTHYRRAVKVSPRRAGPHFSLAELYKRYGRLHAALI